jgi:Tol biopolymer transport system component
MGDVYLADDTRLKRRVALKVLSSGGDSGPHANERLLREARAAARLDHANICTIFDTGEADGQAYIAMQYVEGESLAARLRRKPLDLREALSLASQAANAIAEAHRQGVVHRDVKPENVMVTASGHAKVLDFGLAQMTGPLADGATTVERLTQAGAVAGTVRYMSPEQVKGEAVDERSDVFSLGAVLYQMIGRAHPFGEGSVAEVIAAILTREPAPLADTVPADVRRIINKSLEKDRARRYQTARDLAVDLEQAARALDAPAPVTPKTGPLVWIAAAAVLVGAAGLAVWLLNRPQTAAPGSSELIQITDFADSAVAPAISPDGRMVAFLRGSTPFLTQGQVYVKLLPNGDAKQLTNDPRGKYGVAFTPDGTHVAYTALGNGWETWIVPVLGGEPKRVLANAAGLTWIGSGQVLFSEIKGSGLHMGLVTSTETRANHREIYFPAHERAMAHYSTLSPDNASILVVQMSRTGGWESCRVVPFDGSSAGREVGPPGECRAAAWSPDGQWMYFTVDDGAVSHLWRQRFPNGAVEPITSSPTADEQGVAIDPKGRWLITSIGRRSSALWWRDAAGDRQLTTEGFAWAPKLSRDGKQVFFLVQRGSSPQTRLAVLDFASGQTNVLFSDVVIDQFDISPDAQSVVYSTRAATGNPEVWFASLDRRAAPRRLVANADSAFFAGADTVVFRAIERHANFVDRIRLDGSQRDRVREEPVIQPAGTSPDGRWIVLHEGATQAAHAHTRSVFQAVDGSASRPICIGPCRTVWTTDADHLFIMFFTEGRTLVVPLPPGQMFPAAPAEADPIAVWEKLPGARWLNAASFAPGSDPGSYVFTKREELRNLFQIPIK